MASWIGARWCIVLNALVFVGLHFLYGNLGLVHLVGTFFLSWSFLKSETLLVPIALHAMMNFCYALFLVVCYFCWVHSAVATSNTKTQRGAENAEKKNWNKKPSPSGGKTRQASEVRGIGHLHGAI